MPDERAMRPGEELPLAQVDAWLKERVPSLTGAPEVTQYAGGASNWTYRLRYANADLVLRRPPAGTKAKSAHDMGREYLVQQALRPVFPYVPEMVAHCEDARIIGAPFYVMRRVDGVIPRGSGLGAQMPPERRRELCLRVVDTLVELHAVDAEKAGLAKLGKGPGYARRQIEGWSDRYQKARTWNVPSFAKVIAWLKAHVPEDAGACVVHNDYRLDNLVLDRADPTRVIGVLDWEMATIGDPLMDVGNSMAYWVQADDDPIARRTRRQPTHLPGMLTRREFLDAYAKRSGRAPRDWTFYEVYGLFRLAGIVQQIYYRYHRKETRNPAFRGFWVISNYMDWRCRRLIRRADADA